MTPHPDPEPRRTLEEVRRLILAQPGDSEYDAMLAYACQLRGTRLEAHWGPFVAALSETVPRRARAQTREQRERTLDRLWPHLLDRTKSWIDDFLAMDGPLGKSFLAFVSDRLRNRLQEDRRKEKRWRKAEKSASRQVSTNNGTFRRLGPKRTTLLDVAEHLSDIVLAAKKLSLRLAKIDLLTLRCLVNGIVDVAEIARRIGRCPRSVRRSIGRIRRSLAEILG